MSKSSNQTWLTGERAVEVSPRFDPRVDDPYPRRLNFVAGRTLTAQSLQTEQTHRDRRAALLGRALTPGIIEGLEVKVMFDGGEGEPGEHVPAEIVISPGCGITATGEDVIVHRPLTVRLDEMVRAAEPDRESSLHPLGLVVLSLRPVRAVSALAADPDDPCPVDPEAYVYDDLVTMDGAQIVWRSFDDEIPTELPEEVEDLTRNLRATRSLRRFPMPSRPDGPMVMNRPIFGNLSLRNVLVPPRPLMGRSAALKLALTKLRNDVAYRVFEEEEERASAGERPRWAEDVLPICIAQISSNGEIIFLDRHTVARTGGAPRQATPSERTGLPFALRRARFDQFVAHIQDLRTEGAPLAPASQHFLTLPPVGVIPATLVDFDSMRSEFFPQNFKVEAAPVPIEQFEAILSARAGLAPYLIGSKDGSEMIHPDYVQLLIPVPEHLYESRLLIEEEVAPDFENTVVAAEMDISRHQEVLSYLQGQESVIVGAIDLSSVADPAPAIVHDPPSLPNNDGTGPRDIDFSAKAWDLLGDLFEQVKDLPISESELKSVDPKEFNTVVSGLQGTDMDRNAAAFKGMKPVIEAVSEKVDKANDFIDMSFVRLQSDIYRARKHLVGEDDVTRLATSPVLANLATSGTSVETNRLIRNLFAKDDRQPPQSRTNLVLPPEEQETPPRQRKARTHFAIAPQSLMMMRLATPRILAAKRSSASSISRASQTSLIARTISASTRARTTTSISSSPRAVVGNQFTALKSDLANARLNAGAITWQGLVYGKSSPIRTVTVAERLRPSPAQEAKNAAVATKAEIAGGIQSLGLELSELQLPITARDTFLVRQSVIDDIKTNGFNGQALSTNAKKVVDNANAAPPEGGVRMINEAHVLASSLRLVKFTTENSGNAANAEKNQNDLTTELSDLIGYLRSLRAGLDLDNLSNIIMADRLDPDPEDADEGKFYAAAVDALESAVSMLRLAESRVHAYQTLLDEVRSTLVAAFDLSEQWQGVIEEIQADFAEARHDHAVATALWGEEEARIDAINTRRKDVLEKNVEIIGFARPRTIDRFADVPGMDLYAPLEDPIPACLEGDEDPPEELEEMIEDFREAPVGWFPFLAEEINRIDRARKLRDAWERSRERAQSWLRRYQRRIERWSRASRHRRVSGKAATGVRLALAASRSRWAAVLRRRAERPLSELGGLGWRSLRDRATTELSIEDLSGAGRAGAALTREGLQELDHIGSVAACFLETLRSVPATIRLDWAEALSVHDDPPDLSDITRAPGWSRIPLVGTNLADDAAADRMPVDRRQLEHLHRWLFSRIDRQNPEARAAMSEIVRVCLLLASHAPVSEIVEGQAEEGPTLGVGESFEVSVDRGEAAVGMIATFADSTQRGAGVVEDLVGTKALVRITHAPSGPIAIKSDVAVRFSKPRIRRLIRRRR